VASQAVEKFGNRLRLRVCGICLQGDELLVVNHKGLYNHDFWAPPGGGVEFGETAEKALKREFLEECGLNVSVGEFLFACEYVNPPLHAVELFFAVSTNGQPRLGHDPEMGANQILNDVRFLPPSELRALPAHHRHGIFNIAADTAHINRLRGFYPIT
jgi:8-oxo-dGTP diphosphatase